MPRSDGLTDGFETIQGARTYDSTAAAWTTPDAYAGDARDPASQKSYVWNRNNPVSFSDPAGYDYTSAGTDGSGATNDNAQSLFTDWSATGETEQIVANKYFTSEDAEHAVEGGYATTVVELKGNLDPKNYSDLSHLANNVRDALTKSKLGAWSLILDYVTATLSGSSSGVTFALTILSGMVNLSMTQGGVTNIAEHEYLRYTTLPGNNWNIQENRPYGSYGWYPTDITPLRLLQVEAIPE